MLKSSSLKHGVHKPKSNRTSSLPHNNKKHQQQSFSQKTTTIKSSPSTITRRALLTTPTTSVASQHQSHQSQHRRNISTFSHSSTTCIGFTTTCQQQQQQQIHKQLLSTPLSISSFFQQKRTMSAPVKSRSSRDILNQNKIVTHSQVAKFSAGGMYAACNEQTTLLPIILTDTSHLNIDEENSNGFYKLGENAFQVAYGFQEITDDRADRTAKEGCCYISNIPTPIKTEMKKILKYYMDNRLGLLPLSNITEKVKDGGDDASDNKSVDDASDSESSDRESVDDGPNDKLNYNDTVVTKAIDPLEVIKTHYYSEGEYMQFSETPQYLGAFLCALKNQTMPNGEYNHYRGVTFRNILGLSHFEDGGEADDDGIWVDPFMAKIDKYAATMQRFYDNDIIQQQEPTMTVNNNSGAVLH